MVPAECDLCGKTTQYQFASRVKRFCSYECSSKYRASLREKAKLSEIECIHCKKKFQITASSLRVRERDGAKVKFCSRHCASEGSKRPDSHVDLHCDQCGIQFRKLRVKITKKNFCSRACVAQSMLKPVIERPKKAALTDWSDPVEKRKYYRAYAAKNRDHLSQRSKQRLQKNKDKRKEAQKRYREKNKEYLVAASRARRFGMKAGSFTQADWEEMKKLCGYKCLCCNRKEPEISLEVDHVIPFKLGGKHEYSNIQPLCRSCNASKSARFIDYRPVFQSMDIREI